MFSATSAAFCKIRIEVLTAKQRMGANRASERGMGVSPMSVCVGPPLAGGPSWKCSRGGYAVGFDSRPADFHAVSGIKWPHHRRLASDRPPLTAHRPPSETVHRLPSDRPPKTLARGQLSCSIPPALLLQVSEKGYHETPAPYSARPLRYPEY